MPQPAPSMESQAVSGRRGSRQTLSSDTAIALALGCLVIATHWRVMLAFFSADDLVHLQQAFGLLVTPHQPWRFLTQVVYFRVMSWFFGPWPAPFMLVNLTLHAANVALIFHLLIRSGTSRPTAALAVVLFGVCPVLSIVLAHAVIINDISALTGFLVALSLATSGTMRASVGGLFVFVIALLCKESILFLSLLPAFLPGTTCLPSRRLRLFAASLTVVAAISVVFFVMRSRGAAPSGAAYALQFWPAPFHNLMTYTRWVVDLAEPLPDLVRSSSPTAWRVGIPLLSALMLLGAFEKTSRAAIGFGLLWWCLGLAPVLPLKNSAYPHYMYVALPGLAIALAASVEGIVQIVRTMNSPARVQSPTFGRGHWVWSVVILTLIAGYSLRAQDLIAQRYSLTFPGMDLPLDSQLRSMFVAQRAVFTIARANPQAGTRLAIVTGMTERVVLGARTGHVYRNSGAARATYDLERAVLSDGRALQVFFPQLDSVIYVPRWSSSLRGFTVAVATRDGIVIYGAGLPDHLRLLRDLRVNSSMAIVEDYRDSVSATFDVTSMLERAATGESTGRVRLRR